MKKTFIFSKMHGAGNDFIVTDTCSFDNSFKSDMIASLCDRHRGIGADGFILIDSLRSDLSGTDNSAPVCRMQFFNCDGMPAEMCGNGLRCAALYVHRYLPPHNSVIMFETGAGILETRILPDGNISVQIPLISEPEKIIIEDVAGYSVNTGVPHYIVPVENLSDIDVVEQGGYLRNHDFFKSAGTNVDFISIPDSPLSPVPVRTFERGVEDETAACGTGITAAGVVLGKYFGISPPIDFITVDKDIMTIDFCCNANMLDSCEYPVLTGAAQEVFRGEYHFS